ncbi:MAG: endonuclease/exonuclease/phosphatase family protein [Urechidicola sp.]
MKKLSWVDKLLFVINSLFATILLLSYLLPFIAPSRFSSISIMSLVVPLFILINLFFVIFWIIKLKRQFILSSLVLLIGFQQVNSLYQIAEKKVLLTEDIKIMSYNVRLFNLHTVKKINEEKMIIHVEDFVKNQDPDILCFQEYVSTLTTSFNYPYKYIDKNISTKNSYFGQAIFSKYRIINSGSLNFDDSINNAIFIDVIKKTDTIRVYNIHLESQRIKLDKENLGEENSEKLIQRLQNTFKKQEIQASQLIEHETNCNYNIIICGDFNNTAFSWVYKKIKGSKQDTFTEAGKGFGKTYDYLFPSRIDFILADDNFTVNNYKTFKYDFSDHFPIMARVNLTK